MTTGIGHDLYGGGDRPARQTSLAERILTIPVRHEDLTQPVELLTAVRQDLALELGADVQVRWLEPQQELTDHRASPATQLSHDGAVREGSTTTASFELRKRGAVVAHLIISRAEPLAEEERRLLGFLARDLSHWLTEASKKIETRLITALSTTLPTCESLDEVARVAVFIIVDRLAAEAGMLLVRDESGFRPLAAMGPWREDDASELDRLAIAQACSQAFGPTIHPGNIVAAPVGSIVPARYVLLLQTPQLNVQERNGFPTLMQAARVLEPHLSARWRSLVMAELLKLGYSSLGAPTTAMYAEALSTAVRLVPGSDSGSLLVRHDDSQPFVFHAVHGEVAADVIGRSITSQRLMDWYDLNDDGWQRGSAKVLQGDDEVIDILRLASVEADDAAGGAQREAVADAAPPTAPVKASLCLPVVFEGAVLAVLCLQNRAEPNAFGRDSREVAEMFGSPLANLLQRQRTHDLLVHAAVTDSLTSLSNRRAFDDILERELARTARSGSVLSVLLMDMANFKGINDAFGHAAGDEALVAVSRVLRASVRDGDYLFRWGGDEFAAILVDEAGDLTQNAVERLRRAVASVEIHGQGLHIDIGWAEAPAEGSNSNELLRIADERMYANKRMG